MRENLPAFFALELLRAQVHQFVVIHLARRAHVHREILEHLAFVFPHLFQRQRTHVPRLARNGMRNAATRKVRRVENVAGQFFGNVVVAVDFLDNDLAFLFHVGLFEAWVHEHVGNHVHRERHVFRDDVRVKARLLARRVRFQVTAAVLDAARDIQGRTVLRTLENKMFVKMAQSEFVRLLVAGAAREPRPHGRGIGVRHIVRLHDNAVRQHRAPVNSFLGVLHQNEI